MFLLPLRESPSYMGRNQGSQRQTREGTRIWGIAVTTYVSLCLVHSLHRVFSKPKRKAVLSAPVNSEQSEAWGLDHTRAHKAGTSAAKASRPILPVRLGFRFQFVDLLWIYLLSKRKCLEQKLPLRWDPWIPGCPDVG